MAGADPRGGVVRITVFEEPGRASDGEPKPDLKPVAERLVFRKPGEVLNLELRHRAGAAGHDGGPGFAPGTPVDLSVTAATDEKGQPGGRDPLRGGRQHRGRARPEGPAPDHALPHRRRDAARRTRWSTPTSC